MEKFFSPKSVAVIGASNSSFNLGATITGILNHLKFEGSVYAVNVKGESVNGTPGYKTVLDIEDDVDLAIIIIAAKYVPEIVERCGKKGIKNLIIETAGFGEGGPEGIELQRLVDLAVKKYGMKYVGPNCLGVVHTANNFCGFFGFTPGLYDDILTTPGKISYLIQSGGVGALVMDSLKSDVTKINKLASIGNKADIDEADFLEYFKDDENTEVIGMYLENVEEGRKLLDVAKTTTKPILIFKVGRSKEGATAATSHTAGLANNDIIFDSACKQAGIIRLNAVSELHSLPKIFTEMPLLKGKKIAVVTNSGAFGGIVADILIDNKLEFPEFSKELQAKLRETGDIFNVANPVDIGPNLSKQTLMDIFKVLLTSGEVDGILPVPNVWNEIVIESIIEFVEMCKDYGKPAAIYVPNAVERIISIRKQHNIPLFESPNEAARALVVSLQQYNYQKKKEQK